MGIGLGLIIYFLLGWIMSKSDEKKARNQIKKDLQPTKCPICETQLYKGENIIS